MGREIERKFLVKDESWKPMVESSRTIRQGYLSSNAKATVRVRSWDGTKAAITLKGPTKGASRAEYEYEIPVSDAFELLDMAKPHIIEKRRHIVPFGGLTWEIDVFEGRHAGLVIGEVELETENDAVELPPWVGEEVTHDERYFNASLSRADDLPALDPDAT